MSGPDATNRLDAAIGLLACPVCGSQFRRVERVLQCTMRHSFDIARQGYVNLLGRKPPHNADTPDMIAARERFLSGGHYSPIRDAVVAACPPRESVIEVGAGTGYYLSGVVAARRPTGHLALDVSVAAVRRAAAAGLAAAVADTWAGLPVADACAGTVLCVFAPRNPAEFDRVLRPGGRVVVVTPQPGHLAGLRHDLGLLDIPVDKEDRLDESLAAAGLRLASRTAVRFDRTLTPHEVADLVGMGPNAFHHRSTLTDGAGGASSTIDVAVDISTFVQA